jgi:hypothetical protein
MTILQWLECFRAALFRNQPVQALGGSQRPQADLAPAPCQPARRLAHAVGFKRESLAWTRSLALKAEILST